MLEQVRKFISKYNNKDINTIKEESQFTTYMGLECYDVVEMMCNMEDEYNISIPEENLLTIITVTDLTSYINKTKNIAVKVS